MKKKESPFLIGSIVVLFFLIFFAPSYGWKLRSWLDGSWAMDSGTGNAGQAGVTATDQPPAAGGAAVGGDSAGGEDGSASGSGLAAENESLLARIAVLGNVASQLPASSENYINAIVYSRYPLSFRNELLVNAGSDDGVTAGKPVFFGGILIGTVSEVFPRYSAITTVFDNSFKIPVRIGANGFDALFDGGASPSISSISKSAAIAPGDIVYSAGSGIPYGTPIALISATGTSPDGIFQVASLNFGYDINTIRVVSIVK